MEMMEMSEYQKKFNQKLFETLRYTMSFLEAHNIRYFVSYGSLIGAIRHKGLIPWDDDIDLLVPIEDYERLENLREELLDNGLRLVSLKDEGYYHPHSKIINTNTTLWEMEKYPFLTGIFVDIFPLYSTDKTDEELEQIDRLFHGYVSDCTRAARRYSLKQALNIMFSGTKRERHDMIRDWISFSGRHQKYSKLFLDFCKQLNQPEGNRLAAFSAWGYGIKKMTYPKEWFASYKEVPFEDFTVKIPCGYHEILTQVYGDYMTPPPPEKRLLPYHDHLRYYINLNEGLTLKEVKKRLKKGEKRVY